MLSYSTVPFPTTMAATGVTVSDEVIAQFNEVKLGRQKAKWIIYKIDGRFREWVLWVVNWPRRIKGLNPSGEWVHCGA